MPELLHVLPTDAYPDAVVDLGTRVATLYRATWSQDWPPAIS